MTRLYSLILSLCMMFNITGCAPITDIEQPAQSEIVTETIQTETPKPNSPREDLEIEVAPAVTSTYGLMRVHFIDVGQADSAFIELGNGQTMLIDAGRSGGDVVDYIRNLQYETIDYVVASHPHDDHIGGMATVLNSFNIGKMYMPKQAHTISAFTNMLDVIENKGIDLYTAKAGTNILSSGDINIDVLAPFSESNSNLNNVSAVVRITLSRWPR